MASEHDVERMSEPTNTAILMPLRFSDTVGSGTTRQRDSSGSVVSRVGVAQIKDSYTVA